MPRSDHIADHDDNAVSGSDCVSPQQDRVRTRQPLVEVLFRQSHPLRWFSQQRDKVVKEISLPLDRLAKRLGNRMTGRLRAIDWLLADVGDIGVTAAIDVGLLVLPSFVVDGHPARVSS